MGLRGAVAQPLCCGIWQHQQGWGQGQSLLDSAEPRIWAQWEDGSSWGNVGHLEGDREPHKGRVMGSEGRASTGDKGLHLLSELEFMMEAPLPETGQQPRLHTGPRVGARQDPVPQLDGSLQPLPTQEPVEAATMSSQRTGGWGLLTTGRCKPGGAQVQAGAAGMPGGRGLRQTATWYFRAAPCQALLRWHPVTQG